jgi:thymidylate synthase (FAD)
VTFAFLNVSRVFTHEIVRHRAGTAFSQESLRYVRLTDLGAYEPDVFDDEDKAVLIGVFEHVEAVQKMLADKHGLDTENSFSKKKLLTSAFRRMAPLGLTTNIIVTANHRAWRHMIAMRASAGAEEEIRKVFLDVATKLKKRFPNLYQDMIFELDADGNETGVVWFEHEKV